MNLGSFNVKTFLVMLTDHSASVGVSSQEPREIVVCSSSATGSENGFTLDCGADSVIEIETAKAAHYFYGNPCSFGGIMSWMRSDTQPISCKIHVPLPGY